MKQNWDDFIKAVSSLLPILPKSISQLLLIIAILLVGIAYGLSNKTSRDNLTRAEYERLKPGMSVVQVESILGAGTETEQYMERKTFIWKNPNGSTITVIFEDGKLVQKQQAEL